MQSATLIFRALATGELTVAAWLRSVATEAPVGAALGPTLALVIGLATAAIVLVANLVGTLLPFLLTRSGVDPAVASSPLIASVMDSVGLVIYFSLATWFLVAL